MYRPKASKHPSDVLNGHLNLYSRFNGDGSNLLHHLSRSLQIDQALVNAHLKPIPGLGPLAIGSFTGGNAQNLGGHAHWALDLELLLLGPTDQVRTHLLQIAHVARAQRDSDAMDLREIHFLYARFGDGLHCGRSHDSRLVFFVR